jgi:hypothetical protein
MSNPVAAAGRETAVRMTRKSRQMPRGETQRQKTLLSLGSRKKSLAGVLRAAQGSLTVLELIVSLWAYTPMPHCLHSFCTLPAFVNEDFSASKSARAGGCQTALAGARLTARLFDRAYLAFHPHARLCFFGVLLCFVICLISNDEILGVVVKTHSFLKIYNNFREMRVT